MAGLLTWCRGLQNPSRAWRRDLGRAIVVDLKSRTLSGVAMGEPLEALAFLGRGRLRRFWPRAIQRQGDSIAAGCLYFPALGLSVFRSTAGKVAGIDFQIGKADTAIAFTYGKVGLEIDEGTDPSQFGDRYPDIDELHSAFVEMCLTSSLDGEDDPDEPRWIGTVGDGWMLYRQGGELHIALYCPAMDPFAEVRGDWGAR